MPRDKKRRRSHGHHDKLPPHVTIPQMFMPQVLPMQTQPQPQGIMPPQNLPRHDSDDDSSSSESLATLAAKKKQEKLDAKQLTMGSTYFGELPKKRLQRFAQSIDPEHFDVICTGESGVLLSM